MTARVTGVQASLVGVAAQLRAWRTQFAFEEYAALLEQLAIFLERERAALALRDLERRLRRAA